MMPEQHIPTFDELHASLETAMQHPTDTGWIIYKYIKGNIQTLSSEEARTLLATYTKMHLSAPSMLHSCMLMIALKMSEKYDNFRLTSFLKIWGYPQNLRDEDKQKQTAKDGKTYLSLQERTERAIQSYMLHHSEERDANGIKSIQTMMAVKVFTTERNGRKLNSVKLIGSDGQEMISEQHQFPCKPWEIVGTLFDILTRVSKNDNVRVQEMVISSKPINEVFPVTVGYIERYDPQHGHYHIFDNQSRHFVAENPKIKPQAGDFVQFAAIIPAQDRFKSAIITNVLQAERGQELFGLYDAVVSYVNKEKGYFYYKITSEIKPTNEGEITQEGSSQLSIVPSGYTDMQVGTSIKILMFLTRGKDGKKRNHVAKIF